MVLNLYGFIYSTNTQRVVLVLHELNVPFEYVNVDLPKGEQKSPEYLAKHPFGVVPFMDDDGFRLCESRAICRYICAKHSPSLVPTELKAHALFEQAASIESSYFSIPASTILREKILAKRFGRETDEAAYEEALKKLELAFDTYEVILGKQKYLGGDDITLADLLHIPLGKVVQTVTPDTFSKRANVSRWWTELCNRPCSLALTKAIEKGTFGLDCGTDL